MSWRACLYRVVPYLGRRAAERDLDEELLLHVELERERQRDAGLSEHDANRTARRRLGNATLIRERTRDVWGWRWLDDLGRDLRHAIRDLKRNPGFFAMVVLVLALGIGASTAMFSIVHRLLLRPLPYPDSEAIVLALPCTRIQGWTNQLPPCSVTAWSTRTRYYRRFVRRSRKLASSGLCRRSR